MTLHPSASVAQSIADCGLRIADCGLRLRSIAPSRAMIESECTLVTSRSLAFLSWRFPATAPARRRRAARTLMSRSVASRRAGGRCAARTARASDGAASPRLRCSISIADGKEREARAFLQWARDEHFTIVRVLAMNPSGWFDLDRQRWPAGASDTAASRRASIGSTCRSSPSPTPPGGREASSPSRCARSAASAPPPTTACSKSRTSRITRRRPSCRTPTRMREFQDQVPKGVPHRVGSCVGPHVRCDGGRHVRRRARRPVGRALGTRGASARSGRPVEADGQVRRRQRADRRGRERSSGAAATRCRQRSSRRASCRASSRSDRRSIVRIASRRTCPARRSRPCAEAFIAGATVVPDDVVLSEVDDRTPDAATLRAEISHALGPRAFAAVSGNRGWLALVGEGSDRAIVVEGVVEDRAADCAVARSRRVWAFAPMTVRRRSVSS